MKYFVRKAWDDKESQIGEYTNLQEAVENCIYPYKVFNRNGVALISTGIITHRKITRSNYGKMWEKLKEQYSSELGSLENVSFSLSFEKELEKKFIAELLSVIEKIENEETKILGEF